MSQLALAAILTQEDFGVYAAAVSVSALMTNFRNGGMAQWLIQGGRAHLDERRGDAFWAGLIFNCLVSLALILSAAPMATLFGTSDLESLILVIAFGLPLSTLGTHYRATLSIGLRMREIAFLEVSSAVVQYPLLIFFALEGFGALSFVAPLPIVFITEGALGFALTRDRAWARGFAFRRLPRRLIGNRWILLGTLLTTTSLQVDYLLLGTISTLSVLGVYYFAYQMTFMAASVVTDNIRRVLFPGLVAVSPQLRGRASLRAAAVGTLIGSPLLMFPALVLPVLDVFIWNNKWTDAVLTAQILSLVLPLHLMATVTEASLHSYGHFRLWAGLTGARASCVAIGTTAGCLIMPDAPWFIALMVAGSLTIAHLFQIVMAYRWESISLNHVARSAFPPVAVTLLALATAVAPAHIRAAPGNMLIAFPLFAVTWVIGTGLFARPQIREARNALRIFITQRRPPAEAVATTSTPR